MTGGQEEKRTGGKKERRTEEQEDRRTGGQEDRRTGGTIYRLTQNPIGVIKKTPGVTLLQLVYADIKDNLLLVHFFVIYFIDM